MASLAASILRDFNRRRASSPIDVTVPGRKRKINGEWTERDTALLLSMHNKKTAEFAAQKFNRSLNSVRVKASKMGIRFKNSSLANGRKPRRYDDLGRYEPVSRGANDWTENDDIVISKYCTSETEPLLARVMNVSCASIHYRFHIKLKSRRFNLSHATEFDDTVISYCEKHGIECPDVILRARKFTGE